MRLRKPFRIAVLLTASGLQAATSALAQSGTFIDIVSYALAPARQPNNMTVGPDGAIWFTETGANRIGRITTAGVATEYVLPSTNSLPYSIASGPDGALWFTYGYGNSAIGRITTAGEITVYPVPNESIGITAGPDGALWFTENYANKIGRMTTAGVLTNEYDVPTLNSAPNQITLGPDGALWFTEESGGIGRITTSGVISDYPVASEPEGITAGPDGALWFAGGGYQQIGRITTAGVITLYPVPPPARYPYGITSGPDGAVWFTVYYADQIGRITTGGLITYYPSPVPHAGATYSGIVTGPDGNLWIADYRDSKILRAPACGLGFSASFSGGTLFMNYTLGINTPATFNILLQNAAGEPIGEPFSQPIAPVVPPRAFTMTWNNVPDLGSVTVKPILASAPQQPLCAEWRTVNTAQ